NLGGGSRVGTVFVTDSSPSSSFTNGDVDNLLQNKIDDGTIPLEPDDDSQLLYFVVTQPGSSSPGLLGGHSADTLSDYDFPFDFDNDTFHYGWTVNDGTLDTVTNTFSHELAEAVSDPEGSAIQVNPRNSSSWNEVSDGTPQAYSYRLNGYQV